MQLGSLEKILISSPVWVHLDMRILMIKNFFYQAVFMSDKQTFHRRYDTKESIRIYFLPTSVTCFSLWRHFFDIYDYDYMYFGTDL